VPTERCSAPWQDQAESRPEQSSGIRIPGMRVRIQGYTKFLHFSPRQNSGKHAVYLSLCTIRPSGDSCANMLQRQAAILPDPKEAFEWRDWSRLRYQQSVTRVSEWFFWRQFTKTAENCLDRSRWGAHIKCEYHVVLEDHIALDQCLNGVFLCPWFSDLADL